MLISIETHITCDFPGGGGGSGSPIPTLDPHMCYQLHATIVIAKDIRTAHTKDLQSMYADSSLPSDLVLPPVNKDSS